MMKKKLALSLAAVAMVGTLAVGGTLAWFTDTETATNVVTTGNVDIAWYENDIKITDKYPGIDIGTSEAPITPGAEYEKRAFVMNEGKNDAYIRAQFAFKVDNKTAPLPQGVSIKFTENTLWVDGEDGWYYYVGKVDADGNTQNLIDAVVLDKSIGNSFTNKTIDIDLKAEAIQADNTIEGEVTLDGLKNLFNENEIVSYDTETDTL